MTPYEHASRAAEILEALDANEKRLAELDPHDRLAMAIDGSFKRINENIDYSVRVAQAHAAAALALQATLGERRKVWIVEYRGYECDELHGAFSNAAAAAAYVDAHNEGTRRWLVTKEVELDVPVVAF